MAVDAKYGRVDTERGSIGQDEPVVVFRAQDRLLPEVLEFYRSLCAREGSPEHHLDLVASTRETVLAWQRGNPVKTPSSDGHDRSGHETGQKPGIGRIVHYTLSEQDAAEINKRREDARNLNAAGVMLASQELGAQIHVGNKVEAGEVYPMVITRVWGDRPDSGVNGQVLLDGNDTFWATSVSVGEGQRHYRWLPRI